jgi:hypothetical protein
MQQTLDAVGTARLNHFVGERHVGVVKATAIVATFVEYAYQIDHHAAAVKSFPKCGWIMHVAHLPLHAGQLLLFVAALRVTTKDPYSVSLLL